MAKMTFTLAESFVVNGSKTYTISDADVQSWIDVSIAKYSPRDLTGGVITTPLTPQQALLAWVKEFWLGGTTAEVKALMTRKQQEAVNVPPIEFVP